MHLPERKCRQQKFSGKDLSSAVSIVMSPLERSADVPGHHADFSGSNKVCRPAMRAAYLNQSINLLIVILMVPLLLKYLDLSEYILWGIFTTFGGITLQIENSIQILSVREISREYHTGNSEAVRHVVRRAKKAYSLLAAGVAGPFLVTVFLYLSYVAGEKVSATGVSSGSCLLPLLLSIITSGRTTPFYLPWIKWRSTTTSTP